MRSCTLTIQSAVASLVPCVNPGFRVVNRDDQINQLSTQDSVPGSLMDLVELKKATLRLDRHNLEDWFPDFEEAGDVLLCNSDGYLEVDAWFRGSTE